MAEIKPSIREFWRLRSHFTVIEAALLILNHDPSDHRDIARTWQTEELPEGYPGLLGTLKNAIQQGTLAAEIVWFSKPSDINCETTKVTHDDLKQWARKHGIKTDFFLQDNTQVAGYLDKSNPCYSPKLAAAIRAWEAISAEVANRPDLLANKKIKPLLENWLEEHAAEFGLIKSDGDYNKLGIEEIAKVANWDTGGGAPKIVKP
ncbi:MAG: hypothetical protein FJ246_10185 [Nitrospira sp.]|nr:hypothetical protein [Nitrospira sp.]